MILNTITFVLALIKVPITDGHGMCSKNVTCNSAIFFRRK